MGRTEVTEGVASLRSQRFLGSLKPMLLAGDDRRCVDANAAACLFLRLPQQEIRKLTIDDLTAPHLRQELDAIWRDVVRDGRAPQDGRSIAWILQLPDRTSVEVAFSATSHFRPGRHLVTILFPAGRPLNESARDRDPPTNHVLTKREREVLKLVALGYTGVQIAEQLFLSPATIATHVTNALTKLGAKNRAHGIAVALHTGQIDLAGTSHDSLPSTLSRDRGLPSLPSG